MLGRSADDWFTAAVILTAAGICCCIAHGWRRSLAAGMMALAAGMLLCWHAEHPVLPAEGSYAVRTTVAEEVHLRADGQVQTVLSEVTLDNHAAPDAYWTFYLDEGEALPDWLVPGAQLTVSARVYHPAGRENPGGFDFREYLLQRGVSIGLYGNEGLLPAEQRCSLRGSIAALRHTLVLRLMNVMGEDAGAYAAAMLLGSRDYIRDDDRAVFHQLGIAHILSVSGCHVGVLALLLGLLLGPLPIRRGTHIAAETLVLLAYCVLTGGRAPVVRAALLLLFRQWTHRRNRQLLPLHMLCVTSLAQLAFSPLLLFSASFQLTYGAMLGLLLVFPWLRRRRVCRTRFTRWLWETGCAALSAQLGVLLPQLYWFGELPLLAVLLNIPVMTLATGLLALYWLTLILLPVPGLRTALGALSGLATRGMLAGVRGLSALGIGSWWTRRADALTFIGWGLLILGLSTLLPARWKRWRGCMLLGGVLLTATILIPLPENSTTYTQFSVGDASAAVLQDRSVTVVIDAGEDGRAVATYLHQQRQRVEVLIVTHLHADHGGGIRALLDEGIPVERCYLPADADVPAIDAEVLALLDELRRTGTDIRTLSRGDVLKLPSGTLTALWPVAGRVSALHGANDTALVLHADIGGVKLLLPADLPGVYEKYIALPSDVLVAAHHGSRDSNSADFLSAVAPCILLLSNRTPAREEAMTARAGTLPLYTTARHGAIILRIRGEGVFTVQTVK